VRIAINTRWTEDGAYATKVVCALATAVLLGSNSFAGQGSQSPLKAESAGSFDTPIKKVTVDIAPSPRNYNTRGVLVCYYYPQLLVKEHAQDQEKGAQLSILRTRDKLPACKLSLEPGERKIEGDDFLMGVKDKLVFVDTGDTFNGALGFGVLDSETGKQLFEDWVYARKTPAGPFRRVRVFSTKAGYLLKYVSVAQGDCDLHHDGRACWEKLKAKLDLKSNDMPVCTGYEHIAEMAKAFQTDYFESMVAYPVEVTLSPHPSVKTVAGPVTCWPAF
jgi:hypothetical protein